MSSNRDQQQKWFEQAVALDPQFVRPAFELGKLYLQARDNKQALRWFERVPPTHARYPEARFDMGVSAYNAGDYNSAVTYFREVLKLYPLNEVYNNLGAAESRRNLPIALDSFRKALEGDSGDPAYQFNVGYSLWKAGKFSDAAEHFRAVLEREHKRLQELLR